MEVLEINLFELFATLTLDTSGYEQGLNEAGNQTNNFGSKLKSGLQTAAKVGATAITAVTTAATALGGVLIQQTGEVASYGDNIDKMSQKMGLSATAYQEWDAIMQHSGTSIETLQSGMKTLANAVESGNDAFERLGISQDQIASMDNEQLFSATIAALQNVSSETERTYLAGQLLGRGATELGPLLNMSAEEVEAMRQRVHELGGVMSDDAVKAAAKYQDSLQDMQTAFEGLKRGLVSDMLPAMTQVMDGLTAIFTGDTSGGGAMISEGIAGIVDSISEAVPAVLEVGGQILNSLISVITSNLPMVIEAGTQLIVSLVTGVLAQLPQILTAGVQAISTFVSSVGSALPSILSLGLDVMDQLISGITNGIPDMVDRLPEVIDGILNFITEQLPTILEKGGELLGNLATGIIQAIPQLVGQLPEIISSFTSFITSNLPKIVTSGIELLGQLAVGIIQAIPDLIAVVPDLILALTEAFIGLASSVIEIGSNIVAGIRQGIANAWDALTNWVTAKFTALVDGVKSLLGIASPSKVFAQIGSYMAEGLGAGWDSEYANIKRSIEDDMNFGTANVGISVTERQTQALNGLTSVVLANNSAFSDAPVNITLVTPDGDKFAEWQLPSLIRVASASGTPIVSTR